MAGSVRQVRPGVWEMRVYSGRDPLTGKKTQASRHVRASGKREARAQCDRWAIELSDGDVVRAAGTFGDVCTQRVPLEVMDDVIQPFPTFSEVFLGAMLELRKRAAA